MCEIDSEDTCETWSETKRKVRKEHRCNCCESTIRRGDEYIVHFSVYDGMTTAEKCCLACDVDRQKFGDAHSLIPVPGSFIDMLGDCISDGDEESEVMWRPVLSEIRKRRAEATTAAAPEKP